MKKAILKASDVRLEYDDGEDLSLVDEQDNECVIIRAEDLPLFLMRLQEITKPSTGWVEADE